MSNQTVWGKWTKVRNLSQGGQGATFVVRSDSGTEAVLKQAHQPSSKTRSRMLREVANLKTLHDAGVKVPEILDTGNTAETDEGLSWFVMEYILGDTLDTALQKSGPLSLDAAIKVGCDIAKTISEVHKSGILHRDLKPTNLMARAIGEKSDIVLLDCGLSFNENDIDDDLTAHDPIRNKFLSLSEGNTPGGNRRDPRSDLTAVAALFLYCMTRQNIGLLFDENALAPHRRPGCLMEELLGKDDRRNQVELFFNRAFDLDISNRFQTPEELQSRLLALNQCSIISFRNPIEVAQAQSTILRKSHRKTQLAEYGSRFQAKNINEIQKWFNNIFMQQIPKPFIAQGIGISISSVPFPSGFELMYFPGSQPAILFTISLSYEGHPRSCLIAAVACLRGNEGVILGTHSLVSSNRQLNDPWVEYTAFDPESPPPIGELLPCIGEILSSSIVRLSTDVQGTT